MNTAGAMDGRYPAIEEEHTDQLEKGQVVEGVITKISDTISITLNGKELQVSQSAVPNAKEGQVRTFEITDISKQSIVIREVGSEEEQASLTGVKQTNVAAGTAAFVGKLKDSKKEEALEETKQKAKQHIESLASRVSESDYAEMDKEATPIEEYNEERFERTLKRIKSQKQFKAEHRESAIVKKQEERKELEETTKDIKKRLQEQDLPVTESNIAKVANAMELAAMSCQMTDGSKAYILENGLPVTPETIYKSIYSSSPNMESQMTDTTWHELQPKVEELLKMDGLETDDKTLCDAKWLLQHGLTIDKDTLGTLNQLNQLQQEQDPSMMLELCIKNLAEGGEPKATDIKGQREDLFCIKKAANVVTMLEEIKVDAVDVLPEDELVTLQALAQASKEIAAGEQPSLDIKDITARRQLEEVRLRLTMESSYQLYKKGIHVDTTELSKLVEELRTLENDYYKGLSKSYGIDANERELHLLKTTNAVAGALKRMPATVLGSTLDASTSISMAELYKEGTREQAVYKDKSLEYETLMMSPRKEQGDTIEKAFSNIGSILQELNLEQNESNERAVRILAYNQMPINEESITDMKSYDRQVNQLLENLTPEVALKLIRQGDNPIEVPISKLNRTVGEISASIGETSEEKFSEYLYDLDKKGNITSEERDSYIGIYRLLHQVQKSDGAAVGAVVKADKELTLGNLLTAVRSKKSSGIDIEIDATFGERESIQTKGASISEQIGKAFYGSLLSWDAFEGLSVDAVAELGEEKENIYDVTLEELCEKEREVNAQSTSDYTAHKYEQMQRVLTTSSHTDLLTTANIDITVNMLEAAEHLLTSDSTIFRDMHRVASSVSGELGSHMKELCEQFYERLGEEASLQEGYEKIENAMKEVFDEYMKSGDVTGEDTKQLTIYHNVIRLAGNLSKERMFEIPVALGEEVVNMKVQLVGARGESSKVSIHMQDEDMGTFDATATIEEGALFACIMCDNRKVTEYYKEHDAQIREALEQTGLAVKQLIVTMNRKQTEFYETGAAGRGTEASSEALYQVAKVFVAATKKAYE